MAHAQIRFCPHCDGTGKSPVTGHCLDCHGTGERCWTCLAPPAECDCAPEPSRDKVKLALVARCPKCGWPRESCICKEGN